MRSNLSLAVMGLKDFYFVCPGLFHYSSCTLNINDYMRSCKIYINICSCFSSVPLGKTFRSQFHLDCTLSQPPGRLETLASRFTNLLSSIP